jgi:hypothetical protein
VALIGIASRREHAMGLLRAQDGRSDAEIHAEDL